MSQIKIIVLVALAGIIVIGGYSHMRSFYEYKTKAGELAVTNKKLNEDLDTAAQKSRDKDAFIEKMKKQSEDDAARLTSYHVEYDKLQALNTTVEKARKQKEAEVAALKAKFLKEHPEMANDPSVDLKFMQMTSIIRIDSIHEHYCSLFSCLK